MASPEHSVGKKDMNRLMLCAMGLLMASLSCCGNQDRKGGGASPATWEHIRDKLVEYEDAIGKAPSAPIQTERIRELCEYLGEQKRAHLSVKEGPALEFYFKIVDVTTQENVTTGKWREEGRTVEVTLTVVVKGSDRFEELIVIKFTPMDKSSLLIFFRP